MKVIQLHQEEKQLIKLAVENNRQAQLQIYAKFSSKMLSVCRQYIKDIHHAEDVMITGFMKVFTNLKNFEHKGSFEGWIRRIMVYECIDFLRVKKNNFNHQDIDDVTISENESVYEMEDFSVDDIQNMIDNLPDGYKMVFNLYAIEGYKHQEIAEMLKISEGTSKSQLSHARKLLQQQITDLKRNSMEQNNIDNQIREKLNAREIQPSAQAWDRLDAMLTVSEEKKAKERLWMVFVAASMMLFLGLGFFLFNSDGTTEINNSVPIVTTINEEIDSVKINKIDEISVENVKSVLVQNEINKSKPARNINSVETNKETKSESVLEEKITPNSQLPTSNSYKYVSPENLLAEVQTGEKGISSENKIISKSRMKVDANSLLTNVEKELDDTHKETTLDKLTRKFQDAKSALANRNYE